MKKLNFKFAFFYSENIRSLYYLKKLKKEGIYPSTIIVTSCNKITKDINKSHKFQIEKLRKYLNFFKKKSKIINLKKKNSILKGIGLLEEKLIVFAGNYGQILSEEFFQFSKLYLHVHPGSLPQYRGSTTYYYEYLEKQRITFTSIFLNKRLDNGKIILKKVFVPKKIDLEKMDILFDPLLRSEVLMKTILYINKNRLILKKNKLSKKVHYVIHPLLKHIAILKSKINKQKIKKI